MDLVEVQYMAENGNWKYLQVKHLILKCGHFLVHNLLINLCYNQTEVVFRIKPHLLFYLLGKADKEKCRLAKSRLMTQTKPQKPHKLVWSLNHKPSLMTQNWKQKCQESFFFQS